MIVTASFIFVYYTVWAILLPFFPASHYVHDLFPAREWAIRLPSFALVVGLSVIGFFVGSVINKERAKNNAKRTGKVA
ncbi:dolichol phosphate-mannose biosynthesis regulatory [Hysterangium stoloniferum]|nr:dolichol phosphate-mannose biosynthesis regulatory [Hysterangium stoloniferum]